MPKERNKADGYRNMGTNGTNFIYSNTKLI